MTGFWLPWKATSSAESQPERRASSHSPKQKIRFELPGILGVWQNEQTPSADATSPRRREGESQQCGSLESEPGDTNVSGSTQPSADMRRSDHSDELTTNLDESQPHGSVENQKELRKRANDEAEPQCTEFSTSPRPVIKKPRNSSSLAQKATSGKAEGDHIDSATTIDPSSAHDAPMNLQFLRPEYRFHILKDRIPKDFHVPPLPIQPTITRAPEGAMLKPLGLFYDKLPLRQSDASNPNKAPPGYARLRVINKAHSQSPDVPWIIEDAAGHRHHPKDILFSQGYEDNTYNGITYPGPRQMVQAIANDMYTPYIAWLKEHEAQREQYFEYVRQFRRFQRDLLVAAVQMPEFDLSLNPDLRDRVTRDVKVSMVCLETHKIPNHEATLLGKNYTKEWEAAITLCPWWTSE